MHARGDDTAAGAAEAARAVDAADTVVVDVPDDADRGIPVRRAHPARDVTLIAVVVVALLAAMAAAGLFAYRSLYSPSAFVRDYLSLLSNGRAADALRVPGVAIDHSQLRAAGLPGNASEALLRRAALATLDRVQVTGERADGDVTVVTVSYRAGGYPGSTSFRVRRSGWIGFVPTWRFARSPLAVVDLTVHGSMGFQVNGFRVDKRQLARAGAAVDPAAPVPLLVFSPGLYSVRVDTPVAYSPGVAVLSDAPMKNVPVGLQTHATSAFIETVQNRVDEFLRACAAQRVLQPTGCPFGFVVQNRIDQPPLWSIATAPKVAVVPRGEDWAIPAARGVAHIVVDVRSIYDGSVTHVDQDVPFTIVGTIDISADGAASIRISSPE